MLNNELSLPLKGQNKSLPPFPLLSFPDNMMDLSLLSSPWMKGQSPHGPEHPSIQTKVATRITGPCHCKGKTQIHRVSIDLYQDATVFQEDSDVFWENKSLLTHSVQDCSQQATLTFKRKLHHLSHKYLMAFRWLCNPAYMETGRVFGDRPVFFLDLLTWKCFSMTDISFTLTWTILVFAEVEIVTSGNLPGKDQGQC